MVLVIRTHAHTHIHTCINIHTQMYAFRHSLGHTPHNKLYSDFLILSFTQIPDMNCIQNSGGCGVIVCQV